MKISLKGATLHQLRPPAEGVWDLDFERAGLNLTCPWRIVKGHALILAVSDHGQEFGLPAPIDVFEKTLEYIGADAVESVKIDAETADLGFRFNGGKRIDTFNDSSGYEGWNYDDRTGVLRVVMGGQLAIWDRRKKLTNMGRDHGN
jgi:hypothetical protein